MAENTKEYRFRAFITPKEGECSLGYLDLLNAIYDSILKKFGNEIEDVEVSVEITSGIAEGN